MLEGEKKMISNEFQNSLNSISDAYDREFRKLNQQVAEMEPPILHLQKIIGVELRSKMLEVDNQKGECEALIRSLRSASKTLKAFLKDYDEEKMKTILKILEVLDNG